MENEIMQCPFYVVISSSGPNNTGHPKSEDCAYYKEGLQYFKVVEIDREHRSHDGNWVTYITEDGYCLWSSCVRQTSKELYEQERNIVNEFAIFN